MQAPELALRRLALHLSAFAAGKTPLPLLEGSGSAFAGAGLAFQGSPARKGSESSWFRRTATYRASQAAQAPIPLDGQEFYLVVHWRRLLSKGLLRHDSTADVPADLRTLAHHAWWALLPLIRRYDIVLATLLERSQKNYQKQIARAAFEPLWVGFDNEIDERRFDKQAAVLANSRRTVENDQDGFCEAAARWFADGLGAVVQTSVQRRLGFCGVTNHVRGGTCATCPPLAKDRPFLLALNVPLLSDNRYRQILTFSGKEDKPANDPSMRVEVLRWIMESARPEDGVFTFRLSNGSPARIMDFGRLRRVWAELEFVTPFDQLAAVDTPRGPRESVQFFDRLMGGALSPNSYSEEALVAEAGWGARPEYDRLYGGYAVALDSAIVHQIYLADQRAGALSKARARKPTPAQARKRPARRTVTRMFERFGVPPVAIGIVRAISQGKRPLNFFSTPFDVRDPMTEDPKLRVGRGLLEQGTFYWTLQSLNYFANQIVNDEPQYESAREFVTWAAGVDAELVDRKSFNEAVYSDRLSARISAIARGELKHLGAFSRYEDDQIIKFFTENKVKRLSDDQWAVLLKQLPQRNKRGILGRLEELGKRFAFANGYAAFMRSPYHRKFSNVRRREWIKEGCAP